MAMGHLMLVVALAMPVAVAAEELPGQSMLIERVVAVGDACQQRGLAVQALRDLSPEQWRLPEPRGARRAVLAGQVWRSHLAYVFAGLIGQWDLAQWWHQGTAVMAQVYRGERSALSAQAEFGQWQAQAAPLLDAPAHGADGAPCSAQAMRVPGTLQADLVHWITASARSAGGAGLD